MDILMLVIIAGVVTYFATNAFLHPSARAGLVPAGVAMLVCAVVLLMFIR